MKSSPVLIAINLIGCFLSCQLQGKDDQIEIGKIDFITRKKKVRDIPKKLHDYQPNDWLLCGLREVQILFKDCPLKPFGWRKKGTKIVWK